MPFSSKYIEIMLDSVGRPAVVCLLVVVGRLVVVLVVGLLVVLGRSAVVLVSNSFIDEVSLTSPSNRVHTG